MEWYGFEFRYVHIAQVPIHAQKWIKPTPDLRIGSPRLKRAVSARLLGVDEILPRHRRQKLKHQ